MIAILGGGLSGSLLAYRLSLIEPRPDFLLIEEKELLGGNHTWSFHESDLSPPSMRWVRSLIQTTWNKQEVKFNDYSRILFEPYHSITSAKLNEIVQSKIQNHVLLGSKVLSHGANCVNLPNRNIPAQVVFDAQGLDQNAFRFCGYQKFVGIDVEFQEPHGLEHPIIMDVNCDQKTGYRFFYLLPWTSNSVLIEDTRYTSDPHLDIEGLKNEIRGYCKKSRWLIQKETRIEVGKLPIPLSPFKIQSKYSNSIPIGIRGGYFHWTTGYSFLYAVKVAEAIAQTVQNKPNADKADFEIALAPIQKEIRTQSQYLSLLNRMLFLAAQPAQRWKIFHRFYRLNEGLISRFYQGNLKVIDQARILLGRPPVPILPAFKAAFNPKILAEGQHE